MALAFTAAARLDARLGPQLFTIAGLPNDVVARSLQHVTSTGPGNWTPTLDRKGRLRLSEIVLQAAQPSDDVTDAITELLPAAADRAFLLSAATRQWSTVSARLGAAAEPLAYQLSAAGIVSLTATLAGTLAEIETITAWTLTSAAITYANETALRDAAERASDVNGIEDLIRALRRDCPTGEEESRESLARALQSASGPTQTAVLAACAHDVVNGIRHDGPRAFSLAHFGNTKTHDRPAEVLANANVDGVIADLLGVRRNARIGLAGPILIAADSTSHVASLTQLAGPTLFRINHLGPRFSTTAETVAILENLQAAETIADRHPNVAVIYHAGQPSPTVLAAIRDVCTHAQRVLLCPDADLGGVRITAAIAKCLPHPERARLVDPGTVAHTIQQEFPQTGPSIIGLRTAAKEDGFAGHLARVCLQRGYPVEQEQAIAAAVELALHN